MLQDGYDLFGELTGLMPWETIRAPRQCSHDSKVE